MCYSEIISRDLTTRCYMSPSSDDKNPIVEPAPSDDRLENLTGRALRQRIRQQELLAELGVLALQGTSFMDMLQHGARITAEGLKAEYCKVLEYIPAESRLLVRAGVGWEEGVVGSASVGADLESPSGKVTGVQDGRGCRLD